MEFPISRLSLQTYKEHGAIAAAIKEKVSQEIQKICKDVEKTVLTTDKSNYMYHISKQNLYVPSATLDDVVKKLLTAIVTMFPDCSIIMDPLNIYNYLDPYITIDWS